jgi:hypothetical protein
MCSLLKILFIIVIEEIGFNYNKKVLFWLEPNALTTESAEIGSYGDKVGTLWLECAIVRVLVGGRGIGECGDTGVVAAGSVLRPACSTLVS